MVGLACHQTRPLAESRVFHRHRKVHRHRNQFFFTGRPGSRALGELEGFGSPFAGATTFASAAGFARSSVGMPVPGRGRLSLVLPGCPVGLS